MQISARLLRFAKSLCYGFSLPGVWTNVYWQDSSQARPSKELLFAAAWHGGTYEAENIWPNSRTSEQRNKGRTIDSLN